MYHYHDTSINPHITLNNNNNNNNNKVISTWIIGVPDASSRQVSDDGVIKHETVRHPLEPLHPQTRAGLLELAREVNPLVLHWGK